MDKVAFVRLENSDDILISFSFEEGTRFGIGGFLIQRTPKYEYIFKPEERGASVSWDEDDILVLLDEVYINRKQVSIKTKGKVEQYQFDLSDLSDDEYDDLVKHFCIINFDNSIKVHIG